MSADSAAVRCRGVRGATFIDEDTPEAILAGTRELLAAIAEANGIATEDIASAFFTSTADLRSAFPRGRRVTWAGPTCRFWARRRWTSRVRRRAASGSCCTGTRRVGKTRSSTSTCAAPTRCARTIRRATWRPGHTRRAQCVTAPLKRLRGWPSGEYQTRAVTASFFPVEAWPLAHSGATHAVELTDLFFRRRHLGHQHPPGILHLFRRRAGRH